MIRLLLAIALLTGITIPSQANDYSDLALKARRFYQQKEWASASAMYTLMLDINPRVAPVYGEAIVAAGMRKVPDQQLALMQQALKYHVPFDSVFSAVEKASFGIGQTNLYEDFLLLTKHHYQWLSRTIDGYLLAYYTFRRNPEGMISYSQTMLQGLPDNQNFLSTLAQGYLISGDYQKATDTYARILAINPDNYDALLYLGNYYADNGANSDPEKARAAISYLERAAEIHATPYVESRIAGLRHLSTAR